MDAISQEVLMEVILKAMPYAEHINNIEMCPNNDVRFSWRDNRFKVSGCRGNISVETVRGGFLHGDSISIMLETLLKQTYYGMVIGKMEKPSTK